MEVIFEVLFIIYLNIYIITSINFMIVIDNKCSFNNKSEIELFIKNLINIKTE